MMKFFTVSKNLITKPFLKYDFSTHDFSTKQAFGPFGSLLGKKAKKSNQNAFRRLIEEFPRSSGQGCSMSKHPLSDQ